MPRAMTIPAIVAGLVALAALPAAAEQDCWTSMRDWQPREKVAALAAENGWTLLHIKIDDGCYELVATDSAGRRVEITMNPATLEVLGVRGPDSGRDHGPDHDRPLPGSAPVPLDGGD